MDTRIIYLPLVSYVALREALPPELSYHANFDEAERDKLPLNHIILYSRGPCTDPTRLVIAPLSVKVAK